MSQNQRILLYFVLPTLAPLLFPPDWLLSMIFSDGVSIAGIVILLLAIGLFVGLGYMLMRGSSTALTLNIFLQGLNVIIRLMMLFPRVYSLGVFNFMFVITSLLSIALSLYLVLRLDKVDIRSTMTR